MVPPRRAHFGQNGGDLVFCRRKGRATQLGDFLIRRPGFDQVEHLALDRGQEGNRWWQMQRLRLFHEELNSDCRLPTV